MRSRSPLVAVLGALVPIALVVGLWIGGNPGALPGPLRDLFVDSDQQALDQGLDIIERDYYRAIPRGDLVNRSLSGAVRSLDDRFSPPASKAFAVNQEIARRFGSGGRVPPLVAVVALPRGVEARDPAVRSDLRRLEGDLARALPGARIASYGSTAERAYRVAVIEGGGSGGRVRA